MKRTQILIESKIANLEVDLEAVTEKGDKASDAFCKYSPIIERVFEAVSASISNPIAKWVLVLALSIINTVQAKKCPEN
jgi:hypothetical protein